MRRLWVVERKTFRGEYWVITNIGGIAGTRAYARTLQHNMRSEFPYSRLRVVPYVPATGRKK